MPRFVIHVGTGHELFEDLDGVDVPDIEAARAEAVCAAREIAADRIRAGAELHACELEVRNEAGRLLAQVAFRDALDATLDVWSRGVVIR